MVDAIIVLIVIVLLIFSLKGTLKHFKGESPCCGGGSGLIKTEIEEKNKDAEEMLTAFDSMKEEQDEIAKQKDTLSKEIDSLQGDKVHLQR